MNYQELTIEQRKALGYLIESLDSINYCSFEELFTVFLPLFPIRTLSSSGYYFNLKRISGEIKRDIVFRILNNLDTSKVDSFVPRFVRSTIMYSSPLCDGPTYFIMNFFENCLKRFPKTIGSPRFVSESPYYSEICFNKDIYVHHLYADCKEVQSKIGLKTGAFGSDCLTIFFPTALYRVLFPSLGWHQPPSESQIGEIVSGFIDYDSIRERQPVKVDYHLNPSYYGSNGGVLVMEISGILMHHPLRY